MMIDRKAVLHIAALQQAAGKEWEQDNWPTGDFCDGSCGRETLTKRLPLPGGAGVFLCQGCWVHERVCQQEGG